MSNVEILDCTLRDASYAVGYQFTAEDTAVLAAGLESVGIRRIEIGHGLGLGASSERLGISAATDEEYFAAAASSLKLARLGAFFIPGIAEEKHLRLAAKHGAHFIRVGTNATETERAEPYIRSAKELGMEVSANLMKTYALSVDEILRRAEKLVAWGADVISVVDSAGGMLPREVSQYVHRLSTSLSARIGFHGHDNMRLAVANAIAAVESGADLVDGTLRGVGRSSGNAQTEVLAAALTKMGHDLGIDLCRLTALADRLIEPLAQGRGVSSIELISGYAQFHSSFLGILEAVARETGVDLSSLILRVSESEKVTVTEQMARKAAKQILDECGTVSAQSRSVVPLLPLSLPFAESGGTIKDRAEEVAGGVRAMSGKMNRRSLFTIAPSPRKDGSAAVFPFVRLNESYVIGNAEVATTEQAMEVAKAIDGKVDYVLVDGEQRSSEFPELLTRLKGIVTKSRLLTYRDAHAHLSAAETFVSQIIDDLPNCRIAVCGSVPFGLKLSQRLLERGAEIFLWDPDNEQLGKGLRILSELAPGSRSAALDPAKSRVPLLIGATPRQAVVEEAIVECVQDGGFILDAGVGSLAPAAIHKAHERGLFVHRLDMRAGLSGSIAVTIETLDLIENVMGRSTVAGVPVVAGGVIGLRGTVIVDSIKNMSRVIGIADGCGRLLSPEDAKSFREQMTRLKTELTRLRMP